MIKRKNIQINCIKLENLILIKNKKSNKYGLLLKNGKISPIKYKDINNEEYKLFNNSYLTKFNNLYGILNSNLDEVIKPTYNKIHYFFNERSIITKEIDNKIQFSILDNNYNELISFGKYDFITSFLNIGYAQAKKENKWGWINKNGDVVIPIKWIYSGKINDKLLYVYDKSIYKIFKWNNEELIDEEFKELFYENNKQNYLIVQKSNDLWNLIDFDGNYKLNDSEDLIFYENENYYYLKHNEKILITC